MPDTPQQVEVYNPKGQLGTIPSTQLGAAKAAGYKPKADYVEVVHPKTGQTGIIPKEQWGDDKKPGLAQTQGFVMSPREQQRAAKSKAAAGMKPASYAVMALSNSPSGADPHNPGNPNLNAVPESERKAVNDRLLKIQSGVLAGQALEAAGGAVIGRLTAPTETKAMVESGLLGPTGKALYKEVTNYGPSAMQKALATPTAKAILQMVGHGITFGAGWKLIEALGGKTKGTKVP